MDSNNFRAHAVEGDAKVSIDLVNDDKYTTWQSTTSSWKLEDGDKNSKRRLRAVQAAFIEYMCR